MEGWQNGNAPVLPARGWSALGGEVKSVTQEYEKLTKQIFPDLKIAMLHGRMKSKERIKYLLENYFKKK